MADSFFELKNSVQDLDGDFGDLDEDDEYDAFNDETFGSDAIVTEDDWENTHTLLAAASESTRGRELGLDVEKSLSHLAVRDDSPKLPTPGREPYQEQPWPNFLQSGSLFDKSPPMPIHPPQLSRIPTVEELERQMLEGNKNKTQPTRPIGSGLVTPARNNRPPPGILPTPNLPQRPMGGQPPFPNAPPGFLPPHRLPGHQHPGVVNAGFPGKHGAGGVKPHGFPGHIPHPVLDMARGKQMGRNPPHHMPPQSGMGLFPGQGMPPHIAQEYMMMRSHYEKMGMPMMVGGMPMMSQRMGPPPGMYPPLHNPQMRNDMFGFEMGRNHFHPPHPLLYPHMNQPQKMPQLNQLNWQQKQMYNKNSGNSDRDEYAKLMNNRERTWLLNIQIMQLATDKPHVDDYYYTMWKKKHPVPRKPDVLKNGFHKDQKRPEAFFANNRPNENHRERRDSESTTNTAASPRVYVPLQFENSLGKLQCKSVIAPRVVFDIDVVSDSQTGSQPAPPQKDYRKTKKILLELERLYLLMMEAEEVEENPEENIEVTKSDLINRVLVGFLNEERYLSFLCIRKGKTLLIRCLGRVTDWDSPMFTELWSRLLKAFPTVLRRDKDDALLPKLHLFLKRWSRSASWPALLTVARSVLAGTRDGRTSIMRASPSPSKPVISYITSNQFGVSAVASLLLQGETMAASLSDEENSDWKNFVEELVKSIANADCLDNAAKPLDPIPHNILTVILNRRCQNLSPHLHETAKQLLGAGS